VEEGSDDSLATRFGKQAAEPAGCGGARLHRDACFRILFCQFRETFRVVAYFAFADSFSCLINCAEGGLVTAEVNADGGLWDVYVHLDKGVAIARRGLNVLFILSVDSSIKPC